MDLPQLLQVIAGLLALTSLYSLLKTRKSKRWEGPPEPAGRWPIIGHLHILHRKEPIHRMLGAMADKYGPVFTLQLGMYRTIIVSDQELAKECFTTNDRILATRPKSAAGKHLAYDYAMFGFAPYGSYWREMRKIAMHELLSNRRLEMVKQMQAIEIDTFLNELHELYAKNQRQPIKVEMKQLLGDVMLNVIVKIVLGKRCFGNIGARDNDGEARNFRRAMMKFLDLFGIFVASDALPFLEWLDLGGHLGEMKRTTKALDSILEKWVEEHRQKVESDGEHDFIDVMLSMLKDAQLKDAQLSNFDGDTIIKATCMGLIFGATDTTTVSIVWAITLLLNNPHTLEKAQNELDLHVGKERNVEDSDIKNLVYVQAIIKETLRLYPAAPLLAPHEATKDFQIGGFHVPAGTRLMWNVWKIQRDPRAWLEPSEFRPERFLTTNIDVDVRGQNFEYLPFGSGRRQCPGISFALPAMHLTLARLLHEFEVKAPSSQGIDMTEGLGLTIPKAVPLEVILTPRLPFQL